MQNVMNFETEPAGSADELAGVAWWNGMDDAGRRFWLLAGLTAVPAEAWAYFKRCGGLLDGPL